MPVLGELTLRARTGDGAVGHSASGHLILNGRHEWIVEGAPPCLDEIDDALSAVADRLTGVRWPPSARICSPDLRCHLELAYLAQL